VRDGRSRQRHLLALDQADPRRLRYLEQYDFRLVREALAEREVLWRIAPHIVRPLRFVLPHTTGLRPAWMLRIGLFLYDHLGGGSDCPAPASSIWRPMLPVAR
jgi:glycerol-3-phosphate dehydrogenase